MKYIQLLDQLSSPVFTLQDLRIRGIKVYPYQLSRWAEQGYIHKLKNGIYLIDSRKKEVPREHIAFQLYQPSYLSLEWVLSSAGLIPETVYQCTSVTTKSTRRFSNEAGLFIYRHIKKEIFFGYERKEKNGLMYLVAEPEKALLDYLYLNSSKVQDKKDIEELRFNPYELAGMDKKKIEQYSSAFGSKKLNSILTMILF